MDMIREQDVFHRHLAELVNKAHELGFLVSGGEGLDADGLKPPRDQNERPADINGRRPNRLAVDLNFFIETADGGKRLVTEPLALRRIGEYWRGLDPANRWGGDCSPLGDASRFARQEGLSAPVEATGGALAAATGGGLSRGALLLGSVGPRGANAREDVKTVQRLLNAAAANGDFAIPDGALPCDGRFGVKTSEAVMAFQRAVLGDPAPDGAVDPGSTVLARLGRVIPGQVDALFLSLAYPNATPEAVATFASEIQAVMAGRDIATPLRQAHFLAQIGHESGELLYREELGSGEAYEGRQDLGNTSPVDGPRFKGRGLIQLTGRANYALYGRSVGRERELLANPKLVATEVGLCVDAAGWYWARKGLNRLADADEATRITTLINGGLNGLANRLRLLRRAKALFGL